jgi:uncharacterized protein DUF6529
MELRERERGRRDPDEERGGNSDQADEPPARRPRPGRRQSLVRNPRMKMQWNATVTVFFVRDRDHRRWVLPVVGGTLLAILVTLWSTSAFWYFTNVRFGF